MSVWGKFVVLELRREVDGGVPLDAAPPPFVFDRGLYRAAYARAMADYEAIEPPHERWARLLLTGPWWGGAQAMGLEPVDVEFSADGRLAHAFLNDVFRGCRVRVDLPWDPAAPGDALRAASRTLATWDVHALRASWRTTRAYRSVPNLPANWPEDPGMRWRFSMAFHGAEFA